MPELPEVETIRRGLENKIIGKKISDIEIKFPKTFVGEKTAVLNEKITEVVRRAKVVGLKLENGQNLLFHLKMTGQLIWRSPNEISKSEFLISKQVPNSKFQSLKNSESDSFAGGHPSHDWHLPLPNNTTAVVFSFDDDSHLYFNDMRKFGWCKVLSDQELNKIFTEDYGPEPFDSSFNAEYLMRMASKIPNRKIKQFLTDQTIIAGIGNIYADESLFEAKISPLRKVKDISLSEWKTLVVCVQNVLEKAIKYGGTTDSDYVNAEGKKGGMQNHLNVYRKTGMKCPVCGNEIIRIVVGGRGTHYCPNCQK